jgi:hypothetical protein
MARVNITVPDELLGKARAAGMNVSRLASAALVEELDRRAKLAELDAYLDELDEQLGPVSPQDQAAAADWVDRLLPPAEAVPNPSPTTARRKRTA